jgi:hypothetical protein
VALTEISAHDSNSSDRFRTSRPPSLYSSTFYPSTSYSPMILSLSRDSNSPPLPPLKIKLPLKTEPPLSLPRNLDGSKRGTQFRSITDSPAASQRTPRPAQFAASAPVPIPNPRTTNPAHSPTPIPIPQPSASRGKPPSGLGGQSGNVAFSSFGGDGDGDGDVSLVPLFAKTIN